jgi:hypothetical protein
MVYPDHTKQPAQEAPYERTLSGKQFAPYTGHIRLSFPGGL